MPRLIPAPVLLAAIAGLLFFSNLGATHLWDVDEAIFSQAAKEMFQRGDHIVPYFNGDVFPDKPPLMYWLMISAYKVFGTTELAARFWSAIFGIGSVLLTYRLGRLMFSPSVAFYSALILASNLNFNVIARAATPDSFLVFFSTLAVLIFVSGTAKARAISGEPNERNAPWAGQTTFEPSWAIYALAYGVMGLAMLTKGPVGVVLPTAVIGLFLLVMRTKPIEPVTESGWRGRLQAIVRSFAATFSPGHFLRTVWSMRPLTAIVMVLAVAGPWYAWVGVKTDGQWLIGFFGVHNFGRFLNAMDNHRGPLFYYVAAIAVGFFPWSILFGPSLVHLKKTFSTASWRPGYVLVGSWFAVWVGFFSLAGTKLPSYVLPAYPALALFTGCFVDRWIREPATISRGWLRLSWASAALAGLAIIVAFPIVAHVFLNDDWIVAAAGLIPLGGAALGLFFTERGQVRPAVWTLATFSGALALALFAFGAVHIDRYQDSPRFARLIVEQTPKGQLPTIGSFRYFRPSFIFYTDSPISEIESAEDVEQFFAGHPNSAFVFTTDEQFEKLGSSLPSDIAVLDARPRFLRDGKVLLLGRAPRGTATTARKASTEPKSAVQ